MCPLALLHGQVTPLATANPPLVTLVVTCDKLVWRADMPRRATLVMQTLPYLVALVLTSNSSTRPILRGLFVHRDTLPLVNYDNDQSIFDFNIVDVSRPGGP
jgi:condensin-2 complex subunit G2